MTSTSGELTGTAALTGFVLRRDRIRILVWIVSIVVGVGISAASVKGLFPTQADLDEAAAAAEGNAGAIAFNGPAQALDTLGGQVAFQTGTVGLVLVSLMSLLMVGRLTRGEEEAGRLELVRSAPVGSYAPSAAALVTVGAMNVAVGALVSLAVLAQALPVAGSIAFGASFAALGIVFAGVAVLAAQLTRNTRAVYGIAGGVLAAAFVVRAVGDIGDGSWSWLSPIGWAQKTRPYAHEVWWPFLVLVVAAAGLLAAARNLAGRRDLGGALLPSRPGPPSAGPGLASPLGLAFRLQRGTLAGWTVATLTSGIAYGSIGDSVRDFLGDNEALNDLLSRATAAELTDSFLATCVRLLALVGVGFAVQSAVRMRSEEISQRVEPVLATAVSRGRWAMSHLTVALAGSVVVLAVGGLAMGLTYGAVIGDLTVVPDLLGAALAYAPAMWLLVGIAAALVGWVPRAVVVAWAVVAAHFVISFLGELLGLPQWARDLSPFDHVPLLPADELVVLPLAVLTTLAVGLTVVGLVGLRRRDIG